MPTYEYFCESCQKEFEIILTMKEHDEAKITCPTCKGDKIHQMAAAFVAVTSRKS